MSIRQIARSLGALAILATGACNSLDVANPNEPSSGALNDPNVLEAVASGSLRSWFVAYTGTLETTGVLSVVARTASSSWNNGNMNFYSGVDISPADTGAAPASWTRNARAWQNDPSAAGRTSVELYWYQYYAALSLANSALKAIRTDGTVIGDAARTKRAETVAALMQGASLMGIALNYDKGYFVDEKTDVLTLKYIGRRAMRDSVDVKLAAAAALATANTFTTIAAWTNGAKAYSNLEIAKIANTMAAMNLVFYPRDDAEAATVNWAKVLTYAAAGMSSGTPVDLALVGDGCSNWCQVMMPWFTDYSTGRISTRVAHFIDPSTQRDPYPLGIGNPQPNSPDARMGDGTFGDQSMVAVFDNIPKTANGGTDFAYSASGEVFRPDRGFYHQSNIGNIRWDESGNQDTELQWGGYGWAPVITATINDLIWAEALIRVGGAANLNQAATLINKTRVTRGGLSAASGADAVGSASDGPCMANDILAKNGGACTLFSKLLYEWEVEGMLIGPAPYYNQRRLPVVLGGGAFDSPNGTKVRYIQGLIPGTPRDMPVPAKELGVKAEALYTYGGATVKGPEVVP